MDVTTNKVQRTKTEIVWPEMPYTFSELKALNPNVVPITLRFANLSQGAKRNVKRIGIMPRKNRMAGRCEYVFYAGDIASNAAVAEYIKNTGIILLDTAIPVVPAHHIVRNKAQSISVVSGVSDMRETPVIPATRPEQQVVGQVVST